MLELAKLALKLQGGRSSHDVPHFGLYVVSVYGETRDGKQKFAGHGSAMKRAGRAQSGKMQPPRYARRRLRRAFRKTLRCERDSIAAGISATSATTPTTMNVSENASISALACTIDARYS